MRRLRKLYGAIRQWDTGGRLIVIPVVLLSLALYVLAATLYLVDASPDIWAVQVEWPTVIERLLLVALTPLGLLFVWRVSKPTRRVVWVFDWLGGGLVALVAVWAESAVDEFLIGARLGPFGRFLLPISTSLWGALGIMLIVAGTAYFSDELRTERQERQRLEALMDFTRKITSLDYQSILDEAVAHLLRLLKADSCVFFLWNEEGQVLVPAAAVHDMTVYTQDYVSRMMTFKCPLGFGLTGWVMETGEPFLSGDVMSDPRSQGVPGWKVGEKSSLLAPIQVEGRRLGVVRLTRRGLHQFTKNDLDLALSFAGQAAMVIEHGRIVKELSELSITDGLTGLSNARHFNTVLDVEIRRSLRYSHPLSLVMTDSDSLKKINDLLGHQKGDEHLKGIGVALKASVRATDYAFRYAGDEFLLLLPNTGPEEAVVVGERFRRKIEAQDLGEGFCATVSVGVATMPDHAGNGEALLAAADAAMYESKRHGKNRTTLASAERSGKQ